MREQHWAEAKRLFETAATLADGEREAYLRRECQGDEALLAEVRSLLAWEDQTEGFLDRASFRALDLTTSIDADGLGVGYSLGPWRIVDVIGRGGMGVVYRAERADAAFQRHVAIKVVRRGSDSAHITGRFRRERETLAALDHPNIARLLDGGTTQDGQPYFVMEYVDGVPVDRYCDDQRLSVERRLEVFGAICAGVEYAHRNLVVHRDIKPDNILVSHEGIPKLLDFGVSKILSSRPDDADDTVAAATWLMTPDFASPEQVAGRTPVTTATDVYSLGVLLYVLLTGRRPYSLSGSSPADLEAQLGATELVPPSVRVGGPDAESRALAEARSSTPRKLARRLAGDLDAVVLRALSRDVRTRYASVDHLVQDLERHRTGHPVTTRSGDADTPEGRWQNRHHFLATAARAMRRILVDHARGRNARKRRRDEVRVALEDVDLASPAADPDLDLVVLDQALARLADLDPRQARIVELRFFGGLTVDETAVVVGVSTRTVKREWQFARAWLKREMSRLTDG